MNTTSDGTPLPLFVHVVIEMFMNTTNTTNEYNHLLLSSPSLFICCTMFMIPLMVVTIITLILFMNTTAVLMNTTTYSVSEYRHSMYSM
jgi:hypothetical protein